MTSRVLALTGAPPGFGRAPRSIRRARIAFGSSRRGAAGWAGGAGAIGMTVAGATAVADGGQAGPRAIAVAVAAWPFVAGAGAALAAAGAGAPSPLVRHSW